MGVKAHRNSLRRLESNDLRSRDLHSQSNHTLEESFSREIALMSCSSDSSAVL